MADATTTTTPPQTAEERREELKARIEAAEARDEERSLLDTAGEKASEATTAFTDFVKERPLTAAAGGIILGIIIAGMFKGPRQAAARGGAKAAGLAAVGAEIAGGFLSELVDDAADLGRAGKHRAVDLSDRLADRSRAAGRSARHKVGDTADAAYIARRETGKAIARAVGRR